MLAYIRRKLAQHRLERIVKATRKRRSTKLSASYEARRIRELRKARAMFLQ